MQNLSQTIISEYANSPAILGLIDSFNDCVDPTANIDAFFNLVWNVDTAQGFGLDIWGRIVGVGRVLQVASTRFLGFEEAGTVSGDPFNQSPFYSGTVLTGNVTLTDSAFRILIYAKALSNITDGSIPSINKILLLLFPGRGDCWVADGLNMTLAYTFNFTLTPVEAAIVAQTGILPKSTGVAASVIQL